MTLIDRYAPISHFSERHTTQVMAPPAIVLSAASVYRAEDDVVFRRLIGLREFPMRAGRFMGRVRSPPRPAFGLNDFTQLDHDAAEIVYGLAGCFWRPDFGLRSVEDRDAFLALNEQGIAKLALNFAVRVSADGATELSTETRVYCVDAGARRRFTPYWYLIRPVSGLIRQRILGSIRLRSERTAALPADGTHKVRNG